MLCHKENEGVCVFIALFICIELNFSVVTKRTIAHVPRKHLPFPLSQVFTSMT